LIPNLLLGTPPDPATLEEFDTKISKAAGALAKLSNFDVFAYGDEFTLADIAAILNLPVVRSVGMKFLDRDPLSQVPGLDDYCQRMEERANVQTIRADAAADQPQFMAHLKALYAG
jgi:glutathione S-transferase